MSRLTSNSRVLVVVGFVSAFVSTRGLAFGEKDSGPESGQPAIEIDVEGQPMGYGKQPDAPTFYVWRDGDVWHFRTKTKKDSHAFSGSIVVKEGTVVKVFNFEGLEDNVKKKKQKKSRVADMGHLNDRKNRIDFKFKTAGREDGFDFKLTKNTESLQFDLKLDGFGRPGNIRIGRTGQQPPKAIFTVPVGEDEVPAEKSESKS